MYNRIGARILASSFALMQINTAFAAECDKKYPRSDSIQALDVADRLGRIPRPSVSIRIAYVTQSVKDPFFSEVISGMTDEGKNLGASVAAYEPRDRSNITEQVEVAKTVLAQKPDVIVVTPITSDNLRDFLNTAKDNGIPTIMLNMPAPGADVYVGTSNVKLGGSVAEYMHELYPGGAKIAQIEGSTTSPYAIERKKGFTEELRNTPNLTLAASRVVDWDTERARQVTIELLRANPEIKAIYAHADIMAVGAVQGLKDIGKLQDVAVIGTDATVAGKKSIAEGGMRATAGQFPREEGIIAVQTALRLTACQPVPAWIVSPQALMTVESVSDFNDTRK